jgi:hypothetical protein
MTKNIQISIPILGSKVIKLSPRNHIHKGISNNTKSVH